MLIKNSYVPWIEKTSFTALFWISFVTGSFADINWQPCEEMPDSELQCATVYVPLNHQQHIDSYTAYESGEGVVGIALARLPALDSINKKGTLFLNPGGPGGSGVDAVLIAGKDFLTEAVRRSYDLVGFDPRGIGRSDELTCFEDFSEFVSFIGIPTFPVTQEEVNQREDLDQYISDLCNLRAGELINHMSTADVARDLDLLRQAVGDEKLNFAGYSYGSYLGVTYANLFPEKVGRMIIDGVLDPIAWSTDRGWQSYFFPFSTRIRSAEGAQDTLNEFFRLCDEAGIEVCALANNAESRYDSVVEIIREESLINNSDGSEFVLDYASLISYTLNALYMPATWPEFASIIAAIDEHLPQNIIADRYLAFLRSLGFENNQPEVPLEQPSIVTFAGVSCSDSDNPHSYENWNWAAELSDSIYKYFGRPWTWNSSICHSWPGSKKSRYADGFGVKTENPVLIVNTLFDPATPYHGAKKVNKLLRNSRLLTVNGWGHTSTFLSKCADNVIADYLLTGSLPEKGTSCDVDIIPFSTNSTVAGLANTQMSLEESQTNDTERKELRRKLIKDMLPYTPR